MLIVVLGFLWCFTSVRNSISPQLAGNYKVQARCLRSGGFVFRLFPKFELRNPGEYKS